MPLDLVQTLRLEPKGVLNSQIANRVGIAAVDVLMPRPQRHAEQVALFPLQTMLRATLILDRRIATAPYVIDGRLGGMMMIHRPAVGRKLNDMRLKPTHFSALRSPPKQESPVGADCAPSARNPYPL